MDVAFERRHLHPHLGVRDRVGVRVWVTVRVRQAWVLGNGKGFGGNVWVRVKVWVGDG